MSHHHIPKRRIELEASHTGLAWVGLNVRREVNSSQCVLSSVTVTAGDSFGSVLYVMRTSKCTLNLWWNISRTAINPNVVRFEFPVAPHLCGQFSFHNPSYPHHFLNGCRNSPFFPSSNVPKNNGIGFKSGITLLYEAESHSRSFSSTLGLLTVTKKIALNILRRALWLSMRQPWSGSAERLPSRENIFIQYTSLGNVEDKSRLHTLSHSNRFLSPSWLLGFIFAVVHCMWRCKEIWVWFCDGERNWSSVVQ